MCLTSSSPHFFYPYFFLVLLSLSIFEFFAVYVCTKISECVHGKIYIYFFQMILCPVSPKCALVCLLVNTRDSCLSVRSVCVLCRWRGNLFSYRQQEMGPGLGDFKLTYVFFTYLPPQDVYAEVNRNSVDV